MLPPSPPPLPPPPQPPHTPLHQRKRDDAPRVPEVIALQPVAVIDHSCKVDDAFLASVGGEIGGSTRVSPDDLQKILMRVGEFATKAGGSAANTARGLSAGFDVSVGLLGAVGRDEWGGLFTTSMTRAGVDVSRLTVKGEKSYTGRCVCLVGKDGQRTMRPSLQDAIRLQPDEIDPEQLRGARWVIVNGYSYYGPGLVESSVDAAIEAGCKVAMHLASFEVVRRFRAPLEKLLKSGKVHAVFANEDEARELSGEGLDASSGSIERDTKIDAALTRLAEYCDVAVITLGDKGCVAMRKATNERVAQKAFKGFAIEDSTGAGDLFASGFMYGMLRDQTLARCCEIGCLAGAAVVQVMGAEVSAEGWNWLHAHLHSSGRAASLVRGSAGAVQRELLACYELIEKIGRGVVYYGSARLKPESPHFERVAQTRRRGERAPGLADVDRRRAGDDGGEHPRRDGRGDAGRGHSHRARGRDEGSIRGAELPRGGGDRLLQVSESAQGGARGRRGAQEEGGQDRVRVPARRAGDDGRAVRAVHAVPAQEARDGFPRARDHRQLRRILRLPVGLHPNHAGTRHGGRGGSTTRWSSKTPTRRWCSTSRSTTNSEKRRRTTRSRRESSRVYLLRGGAVAIYFRKYIIIPSAPPS